MKWFDRWFAKKWQEAWQNFSGTSRQSEEISPDSYTFPKLKPRRLGVISSAHVNAPQLPRSEIDTRPVMFKLYNASGGWVLEYNFYDEDKDENINALHVIHHDDDLGQAIARVFTFETLKR